MIDIDWRLPIVLACFLALACFVVGYSLGEVASKTPTDVAKVKTGAHRSAVRSAERESLASGRRRGRAAGLKAGRRIGTRRGRQRGLAAGRRAAQTTGAPGATIPPEATIPP